MLRLLAPTLLAMVVCAVVEAESYFRIDQGRSFQRHRLPTDLSHPDSLQWRRDLFPGQSTPCVAEHLLVLTTYEGDRLETVAIDQRSGEVAWRSAAPNDRLEQVHETGSPAVATVAFDGQRLHVFFGSYGLLCYDLNGNELWKKPLGPFQDEFGSASSPVLVDGMLILNQDHDVDSFLLAVDTKDGETIWKTPREDAVRSYSTPVVWRHNGQTEILVAGALRLTSYDAFTGQPIWWVDGLSRIVIPTPTFGDNNLLFIPTWSPGGDADARVSMEPWKRAAELYDKDNNEKIARDELVEGSPVLTRFYRIDLNQDGGLNEEEWTRHARVFGLARNSVLAIRPGGEGNMTGQSTVWTHQRGVPYVASPVAAENWVMLVKDGGIVSTLDADTGNVIKRARVPSIGRYYGSPLMADGKVYIPAERGILSVISAAGKWELIAKHDFKERLSSTPVAHEGKLFVRTDKALYCFANP